MRRALFVCLALALTAGVAGAAASCSTETAPVVVQGCSAQNAKPCLSIVSPAEGACIEVADGPDAFIPVVVNTPNFLIRPPGTCETCSNCGYVKLYVNGEENNASATAIVDAKLAGKVPGEIELTVELMSDQGASYAWTLPDGGTADAGLDSCPDLPAGLTIKRKVKVTVKASCSGSSDAGTDAATDAGDDAGADAATDAGDDAGADAGDDAGADAATDAG